MPKGSEDLLEYVNEFLTEEKNKGRIDELADKYIYQNTGSDQEMEQQ
jgi:ABC-type amino acid transport substrate-binding protein